MRYSSSVYCSKFRPPRQWVASFMLPSWRNTVAVVCARSKSTLTGGKSQMSRRSRKWPRVRSVTLSATESPPGEAKVSTPACVWRSVPRSFIKACQSAATVSGSGSAVPNRRGARSAGGDEGGGAVCCAAASGRAQGVSNHATSARRATRVKAYRTDPTRPTYWPPARAASGRAAGDGSAQRRAERHLAVRLHQDHIPFAHDDAERQHFREEIGDLARREVHHGEHQPAQQRSLVVVLYDLGARGFLAELTEVDPQLVGGLLRLGEVVHPHDPAHANVDFQEVVVGDHGGTVDCVFPLWNVRCYARERLLDADFPHERPKARVLAQGVEVGCRHVGHEPFRALLVGRLQPAQRLLVVPQPHVDKCDGEGRVAGRAAFERPEDVLRLGALAGAPDHVPQE